MKPKTSGLAITSLIMGILALLFSGIIFFEVIFIILAIIFGFVSLSKIKKKKLSGKGMAIAGIILGLALMIVMGIPDSTFDTDSSQANEQDNNSIINQENSQINLNPNEIICPEITNMELIGESLYGWMAKIPSDIENVVFEEFLGSSMICEEGSQEGQNPNYVYCGDWLNPIVFYVLDTQENIQKKISVQVVLDKNTKNPVETKCDVYDLV